MGYLFGLLAVVPSDQMIARGIWLFLGQLAAVIVIGAILYAIGWFIVQIVGDITSSIGNRLVMLRDKINFHKYMGLN